MLGTIVNAVAIIAGSLVGLMIKGGIPEKVSDTIMKGLGLTILLIGMSGALKFSNLLLVIFSIVIGGVIGEIVDIDKLLKTLGDKIEKKLKGRGGKVSEGFVTASLLFCVGAMAVVGSLESGLTGNHETLFAKSVLDGVSSFVFSSSLGIGVMLSAVSVFLYQGIITLSASLLKGLLVGAVVADMTAVGSLLIIGIGFNMMGISKIKVANLLPGIFIPVIYQLAIGAYHLIL